MKKRRQEETPTEERGEPEPFVRRWMRRKADAATERERDRLDRTESERPVGSAEQPDSSRDADSAATEESAHHQTGHEEAKGDEDMPPLESIDEGGSVADFFSPRVSRELRRAALRRLFSQSGLPVVDELDDYAGDYTKFTRMGGLVTNEMKHRLEVAAQRLAKRADERLAAGDTEAVEGAEQVAPIERGDQESPSPDTDGTDRNDESEHDRTSD